MTGYYISLRLKQFWRFFRFNQFNPVLGIVLSTGIFILISFVWFERVPYAGWAFAALAILLLMELQSGKSNRFLLQHVPNNIYFKAKLAENLILMLPFLCVLLSRQQYAPFLSIPAVVIPYSRYNFKLPKPKLKALRSPYIAYSLEWHNNIRSFAVVYLLHLLLLIPGVISQNFYVYLVPFFLLLFFVNTVYAIVEDQFYIWMYRTNATNFLARKIKAMAINYSATILLFLLIGLIFYPENAITLVICVVAGFLCLLGSLFIKYHFYPGEFVIQISQMVFMGVTLGSIANPSLMILSLFMLLFSYFKARNNLKSILQC